MSDVPEILSITLDEAPKPKIKPQFKSKKAKKN